MSSAIVIKPTWRRIPLICEGWRPVCNRRARKLRKRGEDVRWFDEFNSYAWLPGGRRSRL